MQITTQLTYLLRDGRGNLRTEHIKLKYFTLLPEASIMSREELPLELSVDSKDVENVASSFFA